MTEKEVWVPIIGYEDYYRISNLGRIKNLGNRGRKIAHIMKAYAIDGYKRIGLHKNAKQKYFQVSRLVAMHFVYNPNPKKLIEVNHKNFDPGDNRACNLEWVTRLENIRYSIKAGRFAKKIHHTKKYAVCHPKEKAHGYDNVCEVCYARRLYYKNLGRPYPYTQEEERNWIKNGRMMKGRYFIKNRREKSLEEKA